MKKKIFVATAAALALSMSACSSGLLSYTSTMGGTITIPSMVIDKIDQ